MGLSSLPCSVRWRRQLMGSGKTHTMLGEISELGVKLGSECGMAPRIFQFLTARIKAEHESRRDENLKYNCKCSFLEIYNEQITDLLDLSSTNLQLHEDMRVAVYVENLTKREVTFVSDIITLLMQLRSRLALPPSLSLAAPAGRRQFGGGVPRAAGTGRSAAPCVEDFETFLLYLH
ncbi:hypothetical protein ZWY2020_032764 [Hordeum vulgare]|nr:hypothetical protein ZWY2020_032764 [Hordeum vulgare]